MKSINTYQILLMTFFGTLGSIIIGFIFFDTIIFNYRTTGFQFIMSGVYGSLFFSLLEYKSLREQFFGIIFILILHLLIFTGKHLTINYVIRDIIYLGGLFLSITLYHQYISRNTHLKLYLRSLALVVFYGIINTLFISILQMIKTNAGFPPIGFIFNIGRISVMVALGIGLGIDFYIQNSKQILKLLKLENIK